MKEPSRDGRMVDMALGRIVIRENADQQYIYLRERAGQRGFPIIIGLAEAMEIRRVVRGQATERPLTHQLAFNVIHELGAELAHIDIVDLRNNTFYARLVLGGKEESKATVVDARPSDAIALALRANCPIRVAESVLEQVRTDQTPDALEEPADDEGQAQPEEPEEEEDDPGQE